jgi:hypothetical protein
MPARRSKAKEGQSETNNIQYTEKNQPHSVDTSVAQNGQRKKELRSCGM